MDTIQNAKENSKMTGSRYFIALLFIAPLSVGAELPLPVQSALNYRNVPDDALSVYVEEVDTGNVVLSWNADEPRNPASVEKMVTTLVALDTLGPAYRWKTDCAFSAT